MSRRMIMGTCWAVTAIATLLSITILMFFLPKVVSFSGGAPMFLQSDSEELTRWTVSVSEGSHSGKKYMLVVILNEEQPRFGSLLINDMILSFCWSSSNLIPQMIYPQDVPPEMKKFVEDSIFIQLERERERGPIIH